MKAQIPAGTIYAGPQMYSHCPDHKPLPREYWLVWNGREWRPLDEYLKREA